jgi:hypothetical protein
MTEPRILSISWTQLRVHAECPRKAKLQREGRRSPASDLRSYFPGMVVDHIMGQWLDDPDRQPGGMLELLPDAVDDLAKQAAASGDGVVGWKHASDRDEVREFCRELLTRLEPRLIRLILAHPFDGHRRFKVPLTLPYLDGSPAKIWLIGETDLRTREAEGHSIWDLKGTADNSYWRKVLGQLIFYDVVDWIETNAKPRRVGLIQPMCTAPVLQWEVTDDQRRALLARVAAYATAVWRDDAAHKKDTHGCVYCNVRHACTRFCSHQGRTVLFPTPSPGSGASLAAALRAEALGATS